MTLEDRARVEVCFSPKQYELYKSDFQICVVIDVLRATSAISTGIDNGIEAVIPVSSIDEAREYLNNGYTVAAERGGEVVEGFPFGNSPYAFMDPSLKGKEVVLTTTNGTKAIHMASEMPTVIIGSLNNLDVVCRWLIEQRKDVLLLGSGWKDKFNLEDTICAGAIADQLIESRLFKAEEDSTIAAKFIYRSARENIFSFLRASSHRRRLRRLNLNEDVKYCLTPNNVRSIPILKDGKLVKLAYEYEPVH
ncbi:2-phosphosulfolactate phosphatase [Sanyastnella coralliicola]|uniref:2-phosphosulfolactate phosphatase n=1 Tax=Sanyastnella coralliicola TaxID=3069118 RepID=UPI0027B89233|nr:2-phosphosulfolactate phosphatase [Longitalea sp. SCSIO 12813]